MMIPAKTEPWSSFGTKAVGIVRKSWKMARTRTARTANATPIRLMTRVTASPNITVIRSTPRLNQAKKPFCGGVRCFSMRAHIAGVSVSAMNPERATEITIVIANCL